MSNMGSAMRGLYANSKSSLMLYSAIALLFVVVAAPSTYSLLGKLLDRNGSWYASVDGKPKLAGLLIHTLVFLVGYYLLKKYL